MTRKSYRRTEEVEHRTYPELVKKGLIDGKQKASHAYAWINEVASDNEVT